MAAWILLRSSRSALKSQDLAARCLPVAGATAQTAPPLSQTWDTIATLFSPRTYVTDSDIPPEVAKMREDLEVTDDIVNSEAKFHALFLKWLSYNEHHFDLKDEKAFKERFEIFKDTARYILQWNKDGHPSTCGLGDTADLTLEERACHLFKNYPRKANQVIADKIAN